MNPSDILTEPVVLTALSALASLLIAAVFYYLQRRNAQTALLERIERAREKLLATVEQMCVDKQDFDERYLDLLIAGAESEFEVGLRGACSSISLLTDVAYRLRTSPHLNDEQKAGHQESILAQISKIRKGLPPDSPITAALRTIDDRLDGFADQEVRKALETIEEFAYGTHSVMKLKASSVHVMYIRAISIIAFVCGLALFFELSDNFLDIANIALSVFRFLTFAMLIAIPLIIALDPPFRIVPRSPKRGSKKRKSPFGR